MHWVLNYRAMRVTVSRGVLLLLVVTIVVHLGLPTHVDGRTPVRAAQGCKAKCIQCWPSDLYLSISWGLPEGGDFDHEHGPCNMVNCSSGCGETEEEETTFALTGFLGTEQLMRLAIRGSVDDVARAQARFPDAIRYNADRHAFQILGCDGVLIAHVPVHPLLRRGAVD